MFSPREEREREIEGGREAVTFDGIATKFGERDGGRRRKRREIGSGSVSIDRGRE